jgi:uncharacterized membrane protein YfcA
MDYKLNEIYVSIFYICILIGLFHMKVSSATSTFAMTFSASMSVVEYYLLKRFPIPYGKCMDK